MKTAQDIMVEHDKVLAFGPEDSVQSVIERLAAVHFSGAPVLQNGKVIGVVSESDLVALAEKSVEYMSQTKVREIMSKKVISVKPTADLAEIAKVMSLNRVNRIIVIGQEGQLIGLIARDDLMKAAVREL